MSQHKSLQGASGLVVKRNVLKRFERVDLLKKQKLDIDATIDELERFIAMVEAAEAEPAAAAE